MRRTSRSARVLVLLATGAVICAAASGSIARTAHAAPTVPGFSTPTPSGIQANGFEQDLRLDSTGNRMNVYTSAPQSLSSTISVIWRSLDNGQTFKEIPAQVPPGGKPLTCNGGGDSELAVDSAGHLYFVDLTSVPNFSVARSDDSGASFANIPNCTGVPNVSTDRQWLTTKGDPVNGGGAVFLTFDEAPGTAGVASCPAGGNIVVGGNFLVMSRSPVMGAPGSTAGTQYSPSLTLSCDEGIMGNTEFHDYGAGAGNGPKVFVVHDNNNLDSISMARCDVGVQTLGNPTGLTNCIDQQITSFTGTAKTGGSFATMAIDNSGGLFAVWEQTPLSGSPAMPTGDTVLRYSTSTDKGNTWTAPATIPMPGLNNAVFAWPGAGDAGNVDVAFYGTGAHNTGTAGPDSTNGDWGLYMVQKLGASAWSAPVLASEHLIDRNTIQTLIGGQTGNRTLGDFIQLRIGPQGEANISYSDATNFDAVFNPEAMYVRQNSGPGVLNSVPNVLLPPAPAGPCVTDPQGDATFDTGGFTGTNQPNLDILQSCVTQPDATHYQVTMKVANLTSLAPPVGAPGVGGSTLIWQTQWHTPSGPGTGADPNGGALFMVYMESIGGQTPTCWVGQNAAQAVGGGVELTYPGTTQLTGTACQFTQGVLGGDTITITVPTSLVTEPNPISTTLYSVTASTQTLASGNAETPPPSAITGFGGQLPNLIDVVQAFDFTPPQPCNNCVPEVPSVPLLLLIGGGLYVAALLVHRRRSDTGAGLAA